MAVQEWTWVLEEVESLQARLHSFYQSAMDRGDTRVNSWFLMDRPHATVGVVLAYLGVVLWGPAFMANRKPLALTRVMVAYNSAMVALSAYMCYEFAATSYLSGYSLKCQPVDYSRKPLALRMARVCWWYFFSKTIELLDTVFFILRKKNDQVTFLHVYHHSTMILNWWLGVKYIAGGQSFFLAMVNCGVHVIMYLYYALAALGPGLHRYLWWKRYITRLQLSQFVAVIVHTGVNLSTDCPFPSGYNYAVLLYAVSLLLLFANFYHKAYRLGQRDKACSLGHRDEGFSKGTLTPEINGVGQKYEDIGARKNHQANGAGQGH